MFFLCQMATASTSAAADDDGVDTGTDADNGDDDDDDDDDAKLPSKSTQKGLWLLLDRGANVHAVSNIGFTVLHSAACYNDAGVVALLISRGAIVDAVAINCTTPLHCAAGQK